MQDLNKVFLIGRLTRDAELKEWNGGNQLRFSIAWNTVKKEGNEFKDVSHFANLCLFGTIAEKLQPKLLKGVQVAIDGHLVQAHFTDKNNVEHNELNLVCDSIQIVGGKKAESTENKQTFKPANNTQQAYSGNNFGANDGSDIPF